MQVDAVQLVTMAQRSGRFPPSRKAHWITEIRAGGHRGGKAIADMVAMTPADPLTRAAWARAGAASAHDEQQTAEDALYASLYPTAEQAAADSARIDVETGQAAQRFAEYERRFDNGMMAAAAEPVTRGIAARARATGRQISDDDKIWTALFGRP